MTATTAAIARILREGARTIEELKSIVEYGKDTNIDPDERIMTLSEGMRLEHTAYALDAMEYVICDERFSDEEADAYYAYRDRINACEELF